MSMSDIDKFVLAVDGSDFKHAKELLSKVVRKKCTDKIAKVLREEAQKESK